jgi:hypothetical protein
MYKLYENNKDNSNYELLSIKTQLETILIKNTLNTKAKYIDSDYKYKSRLFKYTPSIHHRNINCIITTILDNDEIYLKKIIVSPDWDPDKYLINDLLLILKEYAIFNNLSFNENYINKFFTEYMILWSKYKLLSEKCIKV